tara:strand:+ start:8662 stop:8940 length:279 start_codon:yes stop_codon:yes gene_type:complete
MKEATCVFAEEVQRSGAQYRCRLGLYADESLPESCEKCEKYSGPSRGVGDRIKAITDKIGIKPCSGCASRRAKLNRATQVAESIAKFKNRKK